MTVRIGRGEFFDPAEEPTSPRRAGRDVFLAVVGHLDREDPDRRSVLGSLFDDVFPLYRERFGPEDVVRWEVDARALCSLDRALVAWSEGWHLREPWVLDSAFATMRLALRLDRQLDYFATWAGVGEPLEEVEVRLLAWDRRMMRWNEYEASVRAEFERWLGDYCAGIEAEAEKAGEERTPSKRGKFDWEKVKAAATESRARHGGRLADVDRALYEQDVYRHFVILARRQVHGWTRAKIAEEFHLSEAAVDSALLDTAKLIGLGLRKGRIGRPPKVHE